MLVNTNASLHPRTFLELSEAVRVRVGVRISSQVLPGGRGGGWIGVHVHLVYIIDYFVDGRGNVKVFLQL